MSGQKIRTIKPICQFDTSYVSGQCGADQLDQIRVSERATDRQTNEPIDWEPIDCEPIDCEPIDCEPTDCEPIDCEPIDCEPTDCEPIDCKPIDCEPTDCEPIDCKPIDWALITRVVSQAQISDRVDV